MARASVETLLPLDTWAEIMGVSPFWFNQLAEGFSTPNDTAQCEHVFYQYSWQRNFISREEIAKAIRMAEDMIALYLGYYPAPKYTVNEEQAYPRNANAELVSYGGRNPRGQRKSVKLNWGKVQGGGILARSVINATAAVVYTDEDGDGVDETFTVTEPTTLTDPNEIGLYFVAADRANAALDETWRLRPVNVTISGGNAVIKGHCGVAVVPKKTFGVAPLALDVTTAANFAATVEVYRVYRNNDTANSEQGNAVWETYCADTPCEVAYTPLCIGDRKAEIGYVTVDFAPDDTDCPGVEPDRVLVNYLSGEPLVNGQMNRQYADIVAHLATALLPRMSCGCDRAEAIIKHWRDVAPAEGEGLRETLVGDFGANPFGPMRGAIYAWKQVLMLKQLA